MGKKKTPTNTILSIDGKTKGTIINFDGQPCSMEGCLSHKVSVRWEDGKLTYPCWSMINEIGENQYQLT